MSEHGAVLGLDLGTGGARAVLASLEGEVLGRGESELEASAIRRTRERHEQDPEAWWQAARKALRAACRCAPEVRPAALSVDGTSGTLVGLDSEGQPTTPGLMYNDSRAQELARPWARAQGGPRPAPTSPLLRMHWLEREEPALFERTWVFAHQADFVSGRLCGVLGTSDYSNALKSGYDLLRGAWGASAVATPGVAERLPRVVAPGTDLGGLLPEVAEELELPAGMRVISGVTDGTAAFLASGVKRPGDDSTTLGTTLVFKRLTRRYVDDAENRLYCHALPGGLWIPGAASSTGAEWISSEFAGADPAALDRAVEGRFPCDVLAYPLVGRGERFPFASPEAEGFLEPSTDDELERYAAMLQGTALLEALAYELLDRRTGAHGGEVFVTGGGSRSDTWVQLRADVAGRPFHRPLHPDSGFGSAILAAAGWTGESLAETSARMVTLERSFQPDPARSRAFGPYHARFREQLRRRGYWTEDLP